MAILQIQSADIETPNDDLADLAFCAGTQR
jgi:hypothetical protein